MCVLPSHLVSPDPTQPLTARTLKPRFHRQPIALSPPTHAHAHVHWRAAVTASAAAATSSRYSHRRLSLTQGCTRLLVVADCNQPVGVRHLMEKGADFEAKNNVRGQPPLRPRLTSEIIPAHQLHMHLERRILSPSARSQQTQNLHPCLPAQP